MDGDSARLTRNDYLGLAAFCLIYYGAFALDPQVLNVHETVHCQNIREMIADGDWTLAHYGGRPWLERPPLPYWLSIPFILVLGDADWVFLLPPVLLGSAIVLMIAWMGAHFFGRLIGLCAGFILATTHDFQRYASGAESDIFLCFFVTAALTLFVKIEFQETPPERRFFGRRSGLVLAFFAVLALTNLTKGLIFGTCVACAPIAAFLLAVKRSSILRYISFWGWLTYAVLALAWPISVWLRYPDALDFWLNDYVDRAFHEQSRQPFYYVVNLPWLLAPWTLCAFLGFWRLRPWVAGNDRLGRAFVFAWAVAPLVGLSLSRHKHHHYLLHALAPWTIYAAAGAIWSWQLCKAAPARLRSPLLGGALLGIPAAIALYLFRAKVPGPAWVVPGAAVVAGACGFVLWWAATHRRGAWAFGLTLAVVSLVQVGIDYFETLYMDHYRHEIAFLRYICRDIPENRPLLVNGDDGALHGSWWTHYGKGRVKMIHNVTFLRDSRIQSQEAYVIGRRKIEASLEAYGAVAIVADCPGSRFEWNPGERQTLFRIGFHPDLVKVPGDVRFSPLQATARAPGPFLTVSHEKP
jgi:4-amino-4-deoxy-L-arabinose transferase-like glycosyltransferase